MKYKFEYINEEEKQNIIAQNSSKYLIEEQNITEGNFLIFSDEPLPIKIVYIQVPQEEFDQSKTRITDLELTIAEMMAL